MASELSLRAKFRVAVIHAHVSYRVGIPAMRAARMLNLPFVYEMRGMWGSQLYGVERW